MIGDPNTGPKDPKQSFNAAALRLQPHFTFGTEGRNFLEGPSYNNLDLSLLKEVGLSVTWRAQFRVEVFNVTKTPHFDLPDAQFDSASFGNVFTMQDPPIIQLSLKLLR